MSVPTHAPPPPALSVFRALERALPDDVKRAATWGSTTVVQFARRTQERVGAAPPASWLELRGTLPRQSRTPTLAALRNAATDLGLPFVADPAHVTWY